MKLLHTLAGPDPQTQTAVTSEQLIALDQSCTAVLLAARSQNVAVSFDDTVASSTNGLVLIAGAQPLYLPIGYQINPSHRLRAIALVAGGLLDVLQLA